MAFKRINDDRDSAHNGIYNEQAELLKFKRKRIDDYGNAEKEANDPDRFLRGLCCKYTSFSVLIIYFPEVLRVILQPDFQFFHSIKK